MNIYRIVKDHHLPVLFSGSTSLGKTIQSVAFLHQLHELETTQVRGPFIVVAPLSLIGHWQPESHCAKLDRDIQKYGGDHGSQSNEDDSFDGNDQVCDKQEHVDDGYL